MRRAMTCRVGQLHALPGYVIGVDVEEFMSKSKPRKWRQICKEVLKEKDRNKVDGLLQELAVALEDRARKGANGPSKDREG